MARFLKDKGLLIQHIPRCGGTWVQKALEILSMYGVRTSKWISKQPTHIPKKHALLSHYYRNSMPNVKAIAVFVRHPIGFYESNWRWIQRCTLRHQKMLALQGGRPWTWHPQAPAARRLLELPKDATFNDWVFLMLEKEPMWYTRLVDLYVGPRGGEFCQYIGHTESLLNDFISLMRSVGYGDIIEQAIDQLKRLGRVNAAPVGGVSWDDDLLRRVCESEKDVIDRFYAQVQHARKEEVAR